MKSSAIPYTLTFFVMVAVIYGAWTLYRVRQHESGDLQATASVTPTEGAEPPLSLDELTLTERSGNPFRPRDLRGKVWIANFFFASCPSTCVDLMRAVAELQQEEMFRDVTFVSMTTDPKNDTPEVLRDYAARFEADPERWLFCTGEADDIRRIGSDIMKVSADGPAHSERAMVIDRAGKVRGRFRVLSVKGPPQLDQLRVVVASCLGEAASPQEPSPDNQETAATNGQRMSSRGSVSD